jgi:2'-5' RNA ligase superfamily
VSELIAMDVLLEPDEAARERARAVNAALRDDLPLGFTLDETHRPHITLLQRYVPTSHLDAALAAVEGVAASAGSTSWVLRAVGLAGDEFGTPAGTVLASIAIECTPALLALHQSAVEALAPLAAAGGTASAFVNTPDEPVVNTSTVAYVQEFVPLHSGERYAPHMSVGVGRASFVEALAASTFESFDFSPRALSVCQLGNLGTARRLLGSWPL